MRRVIALFVAFFTVYMTLKPSISVAAASPPALEADASGCGSAGHAWFGPGNDIVIDRHSVEHAGVRDVTYRLDDANGYWLFPSTNADVVLVTVPDGAVEPMNVSIAQVTTDRGVVNVCPPSVGLVGMKPPIDAPDLTRPSVEHLSPGAQTADPVRCDLPFANVRVVQAVAPQTPLIAAQQGITGSVSMLVQIDPNGSIASATVTKSASPLLNGAALASARATRYRPDIFRCQPISSRYLFVVEFDSARVYR